MNTEGAQALAKRLKLDKISVEKVDCSDPKAIKRILKNCDIVVNSVPWDYMSEVQRQAAKAGIDYVDFCMTIEALHDFATIDKMCKDAGITALTSNGLEPGISDTFARFAANQLDSVEEAHVIDGDNGFIPGMEYWSTWSPVDWIEETTIPAAVFKNGKIEYIPPKLEEVHKETYGVIVYQEQVMKIASEIVLDHVILGPATPERAKDYASLRELGYFYS